MRRSKGLLRRKYDSKMNTESENRNIDLEQLLRTKSWEQLNQEEKMEMNKILSGREEYMRMYAMTNQLMAGSGVHDEEMKPSAQTREALLNAFAGEQRKRRAAWWNSLWYGLNDKLRFDIPIVRIAVAAVLLLAGVFGVSKLMESDKQPQVAKTQPVNTTQPLAPENGTPENNIAEQPTNNAPVISPEQKGVVNPNPVVSMPENVAVSPNMNSNQNAIVQDSAPQYITAFTNNGQPLIVDSNQLVLPTVTFNATNAFCCGTSNGTISATATGGTNYQWTPTTNATVIGLPARSRSLSNDSEVLDVFFAVK
jgi:hypothetical protein